MWCHGTVAELLGEAGLCRCARMPDAAYVQVTDCYWRPEADIGYLTILPAARITVHGGAIFRLIDSKLYR